MNWAAWLLYVIGLALILASIDAAQHSGSTVRKSPQDGEHLYRQAGIQALCGYALVVLAGLV